MDRPARVDPPSDRAPLPRGARWALWGLAGLVLLAVAAPLLCSNQPFLWRESGGAWRLPWLASLFNPNCYPSPMDRAGNGLLLLLPPLAAWGLWWRRRRRQRGRWRRGWMGALPPASLVTAGLVLASQLSLPGPRVDYPTRQVALEAAHEPVWAVYPPLPRAPWQTDPSQVRQPPSREHPLGTDAAGADVLAQLLFGARTSLTIGGLAVALYLLLGILLGSLAGYYGGWVDLLLSRLVEVVICVPGLLLVLVAVAFVPGRSLFTILLIIALVRWTGPARLVRSELLKLRELPFVDAARVAGLGDAHILLRELLPNALAPLLVSATFGVASCIVLESSLSFLGLGDPSVASWGRILEQGRGGGAWHLVLAPGLAIFFTVALLNRVAEGLRERMDPRGRW